MQLEFAVLCDYAGYLPNGQFVVVAPTTDSISTDRAVPPGSVSLAGALRLPPDDRGNHTLRIDATGPEKSRFTVASEPPLQIDAGATTTELGALRTFAVRLGTAFQSPGDYLLHVVIDGRDAKTLPVHVSQPSSADGEIRAPSLAEIEVMYQSEVEQWLELERVTPSEQVLKRIADRVTPPAEWFHEEDLFEPQAEK